MASFGILALDRLRYAIRTRTPSPARKLRQRLVALVGSTAVAVAATSIADRWMEGRDPNRLWPSIEAAATDEQWDKAEILLQKLLQRVPNDARAHQVLAETYLHQAAARHRGATYASHAAALFHLQRAGELCPDDWTLQTQLLDAYLAKQQPAQAALVGQRILAIDATYAPAQLAGLWFALDEPRTDAVDRALDATLASLRADAAPIDPPAIRDLRNRLVIRAIRQSPDADLFGQRLHRALQAYASQSRASVSPDDDTNTDAVALPSELRLLAAEQLILDRQFAQAESHIRAARTAASTRGQAELLAGWAALSRGNVEAAQAAFAAARGILGDVTAVRMGLARTNLALGKWRLAAEQLAQLQQSFIGLKPDELAWSNRLFGPGSAGLHFWQLQAALRLSQWRDVQLHRQSLAGTPLETRAEAILIAHLWNSGAREVALQRLSAARCEALDDPSLLTLEWAILVRQRRFAEAQLLLEDFVSTHATDVPPLRFLVGTCLLDPDRALLNEFRGELAAQAGQWTEALDRLAESLDVSVLRRRAAMVAARIGRELAGQRSTAELWSMVRPLVERAPNEPELLVLQAELLLRDGRLTDAASLLGRAEREANGDPRIAGLIADTWLRSGQQRRALDAAERGLQARATDTKCLLIAAQASLTLDQPAKADLYAKTLLTLKPDLLAASLIRATALQKQAKPDDATRLLIGAVASHPDTAEAYLALGRSYTTAGKLDKALAVYRQGRLRLPDDRSLLQAEIGLLASTGRRPEAAQVAEQAVLDKSSPAKCLAIGEALENSREFTAARQWFQRALAGADDKQVSAAHLLLGMSILHEHSGHLEPPHLTLAADHFLTAWTTDRGNLLAANNLAWLLAVEFQRTQEAAQVIDEIRKDANLGLWPPTFVHTLAVVYRAAGRTAEAREVLETALAMRPNEPKLLLELGALLTDQGLTREVRSTLERALSLGLGPHDAQRARELLESL